MMTSNRALALALLAALIPVPVVAQAICSAPHSSPTLAQSGAVRTIPTSAGWIQVSLYGQRATESFDPLGRRQRFISGSEFDTRSAYMTAAYGLFEGVEVWGQLPLHRLTVNGAGGGSEGTGVGDLRMAVRVSPSVVGSALPIAVRLGVKLPGSDFPVDARVLPLTEGQRDLEVSVESGWSGLDRRLYLVGWLGYRWRGQNDVARFQPGDERFAHAAVGGAVGPMSMELGVDALWGLAPNEQGLTLVGAKRRLLQLLPTLGGDLGPGRLEMTVPIPVSGRNLPAGIGVSVGYRTAWGLAG